jgi:hypothetical protein
MVIGRVGEECGGTETSRKLAKNALRPRTHEEVIWIIPDEDAALEVDK